MRPPRPWPKKRGALLVVDNTFATPYLQTPLDLGADMVMHSLTKYMAGHSDVVMGALMVNDDELHERLSFFQNACGGTPGPQDCFLVLRGLKTLHMRMQRHCENGRAVAEYLKRTPKWRRCTGPVSTDHPNHDIAAKTDARLRRHDFLRAARATSKEDAIAVLEKLELFPWPKAWAAWKASAATPPP